MEIEELEKRIDENAANIQRNFDKIEDNLDKINKNSMQIQENSFALELLSDYKRDKKILIILLIISLILWVSTLFIFHL